MNISHIEHHQAIVRIITAIVGVAAGVGVILFITSSSSNIIAVTSIVIGAGLCVTCIVSPRNGVYVLVGLSLYLDFLKRLLLLAGNIDFNDVGMVLAVAPLMAAGLVLSVLTRQAFHRLELTRVDIAFFFIGGLMMALTFAIGVRDGGFGLEAVKFALNSSCYVFLVPVITRVFDTSEEVMRLLRFTTFAAIPVALYGIWQQLFGFSDFEISYLRTGLTVTVELLYGMSLRPFSTLNSPTALSAISGSVAVLALLPIFNGRRHGYSRLGPLLLFAIYVAACIASASRAGNVIWILGIVGAWAFHSRARVRALYILAFAGFVALLASAEYIQNHLAEWDPSQYATTAFTSQATGIQTYSDRLQGFINLTRSTAMYSPFGLSQEMLNSPLTYNHDAFSWVLTHFGVFPTGTLLVILFMGVRMAHRRIFSMERNATRLTATVAMSTILAIAATSVLFGGAYSTVFPQNLLLWMLVAVVVVLLGAPAQPTDSSKADEMQQSGLWQPAPSRELSRPVHQREPLSAPQRRPGRRL